MALKGICAFQNGMEEVLKVIKPNCRNVLPKNCEIWGQPPLELNVHFTAAYWSGKHHNDSWQEQRCVFDIFMICFDSCLERHDVAVLADVTDMEKNTRFHRPIESLVMRPWPSGRAFMGFESQMDGMQHMSICEKVFVRRHRIALKGADGPGFVTEKMSSISRAKKNASLP